VDGSGNPVIAGQFRSTANFGNGNVTSAGDTDAYVAKYSGADGSLAWFKRFGDSRGQTATGVAVDNNGNVVVTGDFVGLIDFGGRIETADLGGSFYVAKYSSSGVFSWSKSFGAPDNGPHAAGVAVDTAGKITVTGEITTGINFGFGWLLGQGGNDVMIVKFDPNSAVLFAKRGAPYGDRGTAISVDPSNNNILVSGDCGTAGLNLESQTVISTPGTANNSYFVRLTP